MNCNPMSLPKELAAQTGCNDLKLVPFVAKTEADWPDSGCCQFDSALRWDRHTL